MKHYSIIWDGSESTVKQQREQVRTWARHNGVKVLSWKDKTLQDRICNYVGNPQTGTHWDGSERDRQRCYLGDKYTLLKMNDRQLANFRATIGEEFEYTQEDHNYFIVADLFTQMSYPEHMDRVGKQPVFETLEDAEASFELADNQTLEIREDYNRDDGPKRYRGTVITHCTTVLQPWVILEEKELGDAIADFSLQQGIDVQSMQARESELIREYNRNNDLCGRVRFIPKTRRAEYSQDVLDAYDNRETTDQLIKDVRKQIGNVKRTMTKLWKKQGGIDFDLAAFATECNLGVTLTAPKPKNLELFETYFEITA